MVLDLYTCLTDKNVLLLSWRTQTISNRHIPPLKLSPSLILSVLRLPLSIYLLQLTVALTPPSPPPFCSPSGSCLGPLGPGSYQLVMGPGGSGPRP